MLGKLMKYEWRGMRAPLIIMLFILGGTTLLSGALILMINPAYDGVIAGFSAMLAIFSFFLYYFGLIGCSIGIALIIAIRFYRTCYTDQGYLTHTLPVTAAQTLAAKTIVAILSNLLIIGAVIVSIVSLVSLGMSHFARIIGSYSYSWEAVYGMIFEEMNDQFIASVGMSFMQFMLWMLLFSVIECICGVIFIFACVSLGQLYAKHRVLGAILAYFVLTMLKNTLGYISIIPTYFRFFSAIETGAVMTMRSAFGSNMIISMLISVVLAVALYFVNLYMMTKRLNLE